MNKTIMFAIGAIVIIGAGSLVYWQKHEAAEEEAALQAAQQAQQELGNTGTNVGSGTTNSGNSTESDDDADDSGSTGSGSTQTSGGTKSVTMTEIAQHKSRTSCWSAINGSAYDLTSWIPRHPGGEQTILSICGIDGSSKFNGQHGGAALQQQILAGFKIGVVAK